MISIGLRLYVDFIDVKTMRLIILLLTFLSSSAGAVHPEECNPILIRAKTLTGRWTNQPKDRNLIQSSWEPVRFTDPNEHNENKFKYFIKTTGGKDPILAVLEPSPESIKIFARRLKNSVPFAASVVSESLQGTYGGGWGVILSVPPANIISTMLADTDAIPGPTSMGNLEDLFPYYGLYDLDTFVNESIQLRRDDTHANFWKTWSYNEVKFFGGKDVHVVGVFVDLTKNRYRLDLTALSDQAREAAAQMQLPFIILRSP